MDQELTQQIKSIFPAHAELIMCAKPVEDPQDGHMIAAVTLRGTREQLDDFYNVWDTTDTGLHIMTDETVIPLA